MSVENLEYSLLKSLDTVRWSSLEWREGSADKGEEKVKDEKVCSTSTSHPLYPLLVLNLDEGDSEFARRKVCQRYFKAISFSSRHIK